MGEGLHLGGVDLAGDVLGLAFLGEDHRAVEVLGRDAGNADAGSLDGEDLVDGCVGIEALEFRAHLVKEQHIHLMIDETVHLEDASRFNDTFLTNPFFQQLHVIQAWNGKTFVGMPQKNSAKGEREDIAHAVNAEFKADLESAIMDEYNKKMEYAKSQKQQRRGR
mgnify:CR=1 FL=1